MKKKISLHKIIMICIVIILNSYERSLGSTLNGTTTPVYKNQHHVFHNSENAQGYVRINGGFTIVPGATATLDTVISVSGSIDLRETGQMQLLKDLELDSGLTWSSGGYIKGRGNALILNGTLSIPASKIIHFTGDTIIDGKGNTLILNEHAQLFIDHDVTVTLRNLTIKSIRNSSFNSFLRCGGNSATLALDNINLVMNNDLDFREGKLFIHNNVFLTGTNAFIYHSPAPLFIASKSTLRSDIGTTFSFAPTTTTEGLFILKDKTSSLFLDGCSLKTTNSGMRITKGNLILKNKVILESNTGTGRLSTLSTLTSAAYGIPGSLSPQIKRTEWNPNGKYIAIGGSFAASGSGGFANTDEFRVYGFDGQNLSAVASQPYGLEIYSLAWTPDGQYVAIGGRSAASGGGFANTDELRIYSFNGITLTPVTSQPYGGFIEFLSWDPSGTFLAITGENATPGGGFANTNGIRIYSFNGVTLSAITSQPYGTHCQVVHWSSDGKFLAIGGDGAASGGGFANTDEIRIYGFNGATLTAITSQPYGTALVTLRWSPDGKFLAVGGSGAASGGGFANIDNFRIYSFNKTSLSAVTSRSYSSTTAVNSIDWTFDGKTIAVGGDVPTSGSGGFSGVNELRIYTFNGSSLIPETSVSYGTAFGSNIDGLIWHPNGNVLAIGGRGPVNPSGGFSNTNELRLYSAHYTTSTNPQTYARSIIFGDSSVGASANLNVEVLGSAHVTIDGIVNDDSI